MIQSGGRIRTGKPDRGKIMIKILVVEDEEAIANLIRMSLKNAGYDCHVATSGNEGADCLQENSYDLCLFDIMLPGIDGYELLEYAASLRIPVIFLTAKGETLDKVKGLRLGAEDYITKPFEILELLARVDAVLRRCNRVKQELTVCGVKTLNLALPREAKKPENSAFLRVHRGKIYIKKWQF